MKALNFLIVGTLALTACTSTANSAENTTPATVAAQQNGRPEGLKTVNAEEARILLEKQKNVVILDVRTPQEYAAGHLKNATLLNKYEPDFEAKIQALDRTQPYLVYCAAGGRSGETFQLMKQLGFEQVYDAKGFESLKKAGIPVQK